MYLPRFALISRRAALAALALVVMAAAWLFARQQERQIAWFQGDGFGTLTPWEHYDWAMRLLLPRTKKVFRSGNDTYSMPWVAEPSTDELNNAIRHLEAIPPDSDLFMRGEEVLPPPVYVRATKLLPLLRLKRDRPQDYLALEEATYRSCIARRKALEEEEQEKAAKEHPCRHSLTSDRGCVASFCEFGLAQGCAPLAGSERLAQLKALDPIR
jgi:hypothetical protein